MQQRDTSPASFAENYGLIRAWDELNLELGDDSKTDRLIAAGFGKTPEEVERCVLGYVGWTTSGNEFVKQFRGASLQENGELRYEGVGAKSASGMESGESPEQQNNPERGPKS
jgi:hypothetical protein